MYSYFYFFFEGLGRGELQPKPPSRQNRPDDDGSGSTILEEISGKDSCVFSYIRKEVYISLKEKDQYHSTLG